MEPRYIEVKDSAEQKIPNKQSDSTYFGIDFSSDLEQKKSSLSRGMIIAKTALTAISVPAGYFYWNYAPNCVEDLQCVYLVSYLPGFEAKRQALFLSGAMGFSATATVLGLDAADAIQKTWSTLSTKKSAVAYITFEAAFALLSIAQVALGALGSLKDDAKLTDTDSLLELILPSLAVLPTALYNASLTYPKLVASLKRVVSSCSSICAKQDALEKQKQLFYKAKHEEFKKTIGTRWKEIVGFQEEIRNNFETYSKDKNGKTYDQFEFLMSPKNSGYQPVSTCVKGLYWGGYLAGAAMGLGFSAVFLMNTHDKLDKLGLASGWNYALTSVMGLVSTQANVKYTAEYMGEFLSGGCNNSSLMMKFFPNKTRALGIFVTALQYASYSAVFLLSNKLMNEEMAYINSVAIIAYHSKGIIELALAAVERCIKDPNKKNLLALERKVKQLESMTVEQYQKGIEAMSSKKRDAFELQTFEESQQKDSTFAEVKVDESANKNRGESIDLTYQDNKPTRSSGCMSALYRFFGCTDKKKNADDQSQDSLLNQGNLKPSR